MKPSRMMRKIVSIGDARFWRGRVTSYLATFEVCGHVQRVNPTKDQGRPVKANCLECAAGRTPPFKTSPLAGDPTEGGNG